MIGRVFVSAAALCAMAAAAQPTAPGAAWPTIAPVRVTQTPNWSDYRLYPEAARRKGQEGQVRAEVLIDPTGRPQSCRILESSGFAELDAGTCERMMTLRFQPPRDAAGAPVASAFARRIGWILDSARPFASSRIVTRLHRDGTAQPDCRVEGAQGPYAILWSAIACSAFRDDGHFLAAAARDDRDFRIVVRLDASDGTPAAQAPWPGGDVIAEETLGFRIGGGGDAEDCRPTATRGFGPRGLNNLSPCGRLLSGVWFAGAKGRTGMLQTRVYRLSPAEALPAR